VRWIGCLVALCLLVAGAAPRRADHDRARPGGCDQIAAVKALAKLAVRRESGVRPVGALGLDVLALVALPAAHEPPRAYVEIIHASPRVRRIVIETPFHARGPPVG
jgi:hypothetical protein